MSHSDPSEPTAVKHAHSPINRIEHVFETVVFASRWIHAPIYGGSIVADLLCAYKFLVELWEMVGTSISNKRPSSCWVSWG